MMIIGCDFHPSWQQVSWLDTETGCSHRRIMADEQGRIDGWWNDVPPQGDSA